MICLVYRGRYLGVTIGSLYMFWISYKERKEHMSHVIRKNTGCNFEVACLKPIILSRDTWLTVGAPAHNGHRRVRAPESMSAAAVRGWMRWLSRAPGGGFCYQILGLWGFEIDHFLLTEKTTFHRISLGHFQKVFLFSSEDCCPWILLPKVRVLSQLPHGLLHSFLCLYRRYRDNSKVGQSNGFPLFVSFL